MANDLRIMACVLCKAPVFQEWVAGQTGGAPGEAAAKAFILNKCGVESRTELDSPAIASIFHREVRKPYLKWKEPA